MYVLDSDNSQDLKTVYYFESSKFLPLEFEHLEASIKEPYDFIHYHLSRFTPHKEELFFEVLQKHKSSSEWITLNIYDIIYILGMHMWGENNVKCTINERRKLKLVVKDGTTIFTGQVTLSVKK